MQTSYRYEVTIDEKNKIRDLTSKMATNDINGQLSGELDFNSLLVREAIEGNRLSAERILIEVAKLGSIQEVPPVIADYLLNCIRDWATTGFDASSAAVAFHTKRDNHRPDEWNQIKQKHIYAIRVYLLMRGRGKGREESINISAEKAHLSRSSIEKLIPLAFNNLTPEQSAAIYLIKKATVRDRCIKPPRKKKHQVSR